MHLCFAQCYQINHKQMKGNVKLSMTLDFYLECFFILQKNGMIAALLISDGDQYTY
jgi:hypothetical protein